MSKKNELTEHIELLTPLSNNQTVKETLDKSDQQDSIIKQDTIVAQLPIANITTYIKKNKLRTPISYEEDTECGGLKTFVEPNKQYFEVDATIGKTIEGKQGTLIIIPPNAFLDQQGNNINGTVDFELVEALTLEDMILYNLTTTSNGKQLETGGMFYMNASQSGNTVTINPNAPIYTETPTDKLKKGMLAFDSEIDSSGNINWITPKPLKKYLTKIELTLLDFLPEGFANGVEEGLPYKNYKKTSNELVDSLYYALRESQVNQENSIIEEEPSIEKQKKERKFRLMHSLGAFKRPKTQKETGIVTGLVFDEKGELLPFVNVTLLLNNELYMGSTTGFDGEYKIENITPGNYSLEVNFVGYKTYSQEVLVINGKNTIPQITLYEGPVFDDNKKWKRKSKRKKGNKKSWKQCGINPLSIKTIKTPEFEQTYLATKEMEERLFYLHQIDNGDSLLNIYIDNLGNDLYIADSLVAFALIPISN